MARDNGGAKQISTIEGGVGEGEEGMGGTVLRRRTGRGAVGENVRAPPQRSGSVLAAETWRMPDINSGITPPRRLPRAPTPSKRKLFSANTPTRCLSVVLSVSKGRLVTQ